MVAKIKTGFNSFNFYSVNVGRKIIVVDNGFESFSFGVGGGVFPIGGNRGIVNVISSVDIN